MVCLVSISTLISRHVHNELSDWLGIEKEKIAKLKIESHDNMVDVSFDVLSDGSKQPHVAVNDFLEKAITILF